MSRHGYGQAGQPQTATVQPRSLLPFEAWRAEGSKKRDVATVFTFFGGNFGRFKSLPLEDTPIPALLVLSLVLVAGATLIRRRSLLITAGVTVMALSVLMSVRLSQGWDEVYINLRHARVFADTWRFSFNYKEMAEATVDFLPFFLVGVAGKFGAPLEEAAIAMSCFGNALVMIGGGLLAKHISGSRGVGIWTGAALALFPCVLWVGATGFMATVFAGFILLVLYSYLADWPGPRAKWALLGILPLIRVEGILLAAFIWLIDAGMRAVRQKRDKALLISLFYDGVLAAGPFFILSAWRLMVFGRILPTPVTFKNTGGDPTYFWGGMHQFKDSILLFGLPLWLLVLVPVLGFGVFRGWIQSRVPWVLLALVAFTSVYFSGGGDWFPLVWNRYMMPCTLTLVATGVAGAWVVASRLSRGRAHYTWLLLAVVFGPLLPAIWFGDRAVAYRDLLPELENRDNRWDRVSHLARFGDFLKRTTPEGIRVASPEMSTLMYFAEREVFDLMGIANRGIAESPLAPLYPGDVVHRRRNPDVIREFLPEVIALYEMVGSPLTDHMKQNVNDVANHVGGIGFNQSMVDIAYFRAGSYDHLFSLGYRYMVASMPDITYNYMVHSSIYDRHVQALTKLGFKPMGSATIDYRVNPDIVARFSADGSELRVKSH